MVNTTTVRMFDSTVKELKKFTVVVTRSSISFATQNPSEVIYWPTIAATTTPATRMTMNKPRMTTSSCRGSRASREMLAAWPRLRSRQNFALS
jgi:hypothetical protein